MSEGCGSSYGLHYERWLWILVRCGLWVKVVDLGMVWVMKVREGCGSRIKDSEERRNSLSTTSVLDIGRSVGSVSRNMGRTGCETVSKAKTFEVKF
ncbi:hypothetical protein AVEN_249815-1 [Araneus ventricosus]|uniref:Uncharacterized protein n=1 Tax=Araneus ventricosus TaxID=182803 RepID=A0A4Y2RFC5_ARAVE|nr:hypothetical protein AVEN_249815-1 [Araneus ventricosus]